MTQHWSEIEKIGVLKKSERYNLMPNDVRLENHVNNCHMMKYHCSHLNEGEYIARVKLERVKITNSINPSGVGNGPAAK